MKEKKKLFIITGAYGKTGKTSLSISIGLHFLKQKQNVRFIDTNSQNPDIGRVFDFFHKAETKSKFSSYVESYTWEKRATDFGKESYLEILTPDQPSESFQDNIMFIAEVMQTFQDDAILIVDTNHHISISSSLNRIFSVSEFKRYKKYYDNYDVTFLHFWDFSSISYLPEIKRTKKAITALEKLNIKVINIFSAHMMQVLSLLTFRSGRSTQKNLNELDKLFIKSNKNCQKYDRVEYPFDLFYQNLKIAAGKAYSLKGRDIKAVSESYPKIWTELFKSINDYIKKKENKKNYCIDNIILIPYFREMIGVVNRISMVGIRNLEELEKIIKKYYDVIEASLNY